MMKRLLMSLMALAPVAGIYSQLYEVSLEEKVSNSKLIVEGTVLKQHCFYGPNKQMIYTASTFGVFKSFKGQETVETIEVVTAGGAMEDMAVVADHVGVLHVGQTGMLFLENVWNGMKDPLNGSELFQLYAAEQSILDYDLLQNKATCPFAQYDGITTTLYKSVQAITGKAYKSISNVNIDNEISKYNVPRQQSHSISNFSPASVYAGALLDPAKNVLTINGNGFGSSPGLNHQVLFRDGNDNKENPTVAIPYGDPHIVSWSNTQIRVKVPQNASTGKLAVTIAAGDTAYASTNLQVTTSIITVSFNNGVLNEPRLVADNGVFGGYSIFYSTSTAGNGANITTSPVFPLVKRAVKTWIDDAGANFLEAGNTATQVVADDAYNIIMLDNNNTGVAPLASGVLGVCYNKFVSCNTSINNAQKTDFDIIIRNAGVSTGTANFDNGPCAPTFTDPQRIDLETVVFHELGHALNLGHVNIPTQVPTHVDYAYVNFANPPGVMHYALTPWVVRRSMDESALAGVIHTINPIGVSLGACRATAEMTPKANQRPANDGCPAVFPAGTTAPGTVLNINLINATSNRNQDPSYQQLLSNYPDAGISQTNNVYQVMKTSANGDITFNVTNYETIPAEVASTCGDEQGVLVSLYNVTSCPVGGAYPAPVVNFFIDKNESINLTGAPAGLTLLAVFNGYRNTKARFTVTLTGSALPITLASFEGRKLQNNTNELTAVISTAENVKEIVLERSIDAIHFEPLENLKQKNNGSFAGRHVIIDASPAKAINFYRLKTTDNDGKIHLSIMVSLDNSAGDGIISVSPNPVANYLQISNLPANDKGLNMRIIDINGRMIRQKGLGQQGGNQSISTDGMLPGTYMLQVLDAGGQILKTEKIIKL